MGQPPKRPSRRSMGGCMLCHWRLLVIFSIISLYEIHEDPNSFMQNCIIRDALDQREQHGPGSKLHLQRSWATLLDF
jgi:hypothetical protein